MLPLISAIIVTCMNHPFKIKICGVTSVADALMVAASPADAIGLNFYPPSKRYVELSAAQEIVKAVGQTGTAMTTVGVFVNSDLDHILSLASQLELDTIQLHGDETPEFLQQLIEAALDRSLNFDVIRAIRTLPSNCQSDQQNNIDQSNQSEMDLAAIEAEINRWAGAGAAAILIDAAVAGDFGGTGKQVDWNGFAKINSPVPKILAGGLTPENIQAALETANPAIVDVASGVESAPGIKNGLKTHSFATQSRDFLGID